MLEGRNVPAEKIPASIALAERFEDYILSTGEGFTPQVAWDFSKILITEGLNSEENFITLARYGLFIKRNPIYVAFLESLDGGEAQENLYRLLNHLPGHKVRLHDHHRPQPVGFIPSGKSQPILHPPQIFQRHDQMHPHRFFEQVQPMEEYRPDRRF